LAVLAFVRHGVHSEFVRALLFVLLLCSAPVLAADVAAPLAPFEGSQLLASDYRANDELELQTSTFKEYNLTAKKRLYVQPPLRLVGAHSTLWYQVSNYASASEVMQHYREQLAKRGFEVVYDSSADPNAKKSWSNGFLTAFEVSHELSAKGRWAFNGADSQTVRTLTAKHVDAHGGTYVALVAVEWPANVGAYEVERGTYVALDVLESKSIPQGTDSQDLARAIESEGHVALYDLEFDGDKPRSVERIARLLQAAPQLKLHIVVHTDNSAPLEASLAQSKRRAHAIVAALKSAGRVTGEGLGPLAPVATNTTEEGRAENRRVELVAQ
jgi:outer membrane protein OmpA-like peptidoglycan-associated protein